jgi:hypothetical protein
LSRAWTPSAAKKLLYHEEVVKTLH